MAEKYFMTYSPAPPGPLRLSDSVDVSKGTLTLALLLGGAMKLAFTGLAVYGGYKFITRKRGKK